MKLSHVVFDCDGTLLDPRAQGKAYAGVALLLQRLQELGVHLSIWTGRDRASTERFLLNNQLLRYFEAMSCAQEAPPKPHCQALETLCQGALPENVVVIGDSWADMRGAQLFGAKALGVQWNRDADAEALLDFGAHRLVSSPEECYTALLALNEG